MTTFSRTTSGAYNENTGSYGSPTVTTITGACVQVRPSITRYQALNLVLESMPTLLFVPTAYGAVPMPGDVVTWAGREYTVRDVDPLQPDGVCILARIVVG